MKKSVFFKKVEKLQISKTSIAYRFLMEIGGAPGKASGVFRKNGVHRPCYTRGCGRFCSNLDHTDEICRFLEKLNVKFELGNDAPRGGLTGNFIKIKTKITE